MLILNFAPARAIYIFLGLILMLCHRETHITHKRTKKVCRGPSGDRTHYLQTEATSSATFVSCHNYTMPVNSLEYLYMYWNIWYFSFTDCKIVWDVIDFETYGPSFGKWSEWISVIALQIHFMQLWKSRLISSHCSRSAEGANGVRFTWIPPVLTTLWSVFCKVQAIPHYMSGKYCNRLILFRLHVSHKVPLARSWSKCGRLNLLISGLFGHRQRISTPREDRFLLRMMHANRVLSSNRLKAQLIRHTGRRLSVRTITRGLLALGYQSCWLARCPRLT